MAPPEQAGTGQQRPRPPVVETASPARPEVELDELVDRALYKLMRRLAVEGERRGVGRWR